MQWLCKYSVKKSTEKRRTHKTEITTRRLSYSEYWKKRRGARADKLILCPLKAKYSNELEISNFKQPLKI